MRGTSLNAVVKWCDHTLRNDRFQDWDGAVNGLQVENRGQVTRVAATVDASLATVRMAVAAGVDLLLVHHGLFWGPTHPWVGKKYELLRELLDNNVAVYSAHLPLDAHPVYGNNARLASALGFHKLNPFFFEKGAYLGYQTQLRLARPELVGRLEKATGGKVTLIPGGPTICRRIGIVTGGAGGELKLAAREGVDTFITGEGPHWTYALAEELGINVLYGGHYATETFGVKALAEKISTKFKVPWIFLDHPTGL